jgi:GLPGLI family protein
MVKNSKYIILFIVFCFGCLTSLVGQSKHLQIEYSLNLKLLNDVSSSTELVNTIIKNIKPYQDRLSYVLKLDENQSTFYGKSFLESDLNPQVASQLKLHSGFDEVYYQSSQDNYFIIQFTSRAFSGIVIKNKKIDFDWQISKSNQKIILGYKCFYAETSFEIGRDKYYIEAWFTPEINANLGPKNLRGLPGVILAFEENNKKYFEAKEISESKQSRVKIPEFKSTMTYNEFTNFLIKNYGVNED